MKPQRNASVGDIVLLKDKQLSRLDWATGVIIASTPDKDGLVRKVTVQQYKQPGQASNPPLKDRAIHDLVLIKAITAQDNPRPDCTTSSKAPENAHTLMSHITPEEEGLFWSDPSERFRTRIQSTEDRIHQPEQEITPLPEQDIAYLQDASTSIINKIHRIRQERKNTKLSPDAPPFKPKSRTPSPVYSTITTSAQIHGHPKLDWKAHYAQSEIDQGHL